MSWTNEEEKKKYEQMQSTCFLKKETRGEKCPKCSHGIKSGENKFTVNYSCGHSRKIKQ